MNIENVNVSFLILVIGGIIFSIIILTVAVTLIKYFKFRKREVDFKLPNLDKNKNNKSFLKSKVKRRVPIINRKTERYLSRLQGNDLDYSFIDEYIDSIKFKKSKDDTYNYNYKLPEITEIKCAEPFYQMLDDFEEGKS